MIYLLSLIYTAILIFNFGFADRVKREEKASLFAFQPELAKLSHFNFKSLTSDFLWIQLLSNLEQKYSEPSHKSWQFYMIDTITYLSPDLRFVYRHGGEFLSLIVEDKIGAQKVFDKGVLRFPHYWPLLYSAAYHYMAELKQPKKAADLYLKAYQNGAPLWLASLVGSLYTEAGQKELAIRSLRSFLEQHPEGELALRVQNKLKKLLSNP